MIVAIGVAYGLSRLLMRGLSQLKQGAESIGAGNLEQAIPLHGHDELTDLASSLNEMTRNPLAHLQEKETLRHSQE
jgi:methyl-accepting chemotaxis protein